MPRPYTQGSRFDWGSLFGGGGGFQLPNQQQAQTAPTQQAAQPGFGSLDWFKNSLQRQASLHGDYGGWNNLLKQPIGAFSPQLTEAGLANTPQAYASLFEILGNQGRTDRGMMNSVLSQVDRDTQNRQRQFGESMAAGLNQGSGVANAIQAAIGQGGADTRANILYQEEQNREERWRRDLDLFMRMIADPSMAIGGVERRADAAEGQGSNAWGNIARLLGSGAQAASMFYGGPAAGAAAKNVVRQ